jgi:hypothetical protein
LIPESLCYPKKNELANIKGSRTIFSYTVKDDTKIISHIVPWGNDTSGRPDNFLAHHLVLENKEEQIPAGPAWLLKRRSWIEEYQKWEPFKLTTMDNDNDYYCEDRKTWQEIFNNNGEKESEKIIHSATTQERGIILFDSKLEKHSSETLLDLFYEAFSWIEKKEDRWKITFSTFATETSHRNLNWQWVCVDYNDQKSRDVFNKNRKLIIELPQQ